MLGTLNANHQQIENHPIIMPHSDYLPSHPPREQHRNHRIGWLRAGVMGANDGIISTASLLTGIVASGLDTTTIMIAGTSALIAGAASMAAGEYVSVSSQADAENADLATEARELEQDPQFEELELAGIYEERGLDPQLAAQVAAQLMEKDPLGAHARDELGIQTNFRPRPLQAAWVSGLSFFIGALIPLLAATYQPGISTLTVTTIIALSVLGALSGYLGGASIIKAAFRVTIWGMVAMLVTYLVGSFLGQLL